jgi:redox-sensitive bicupin YhaK (pirin superfamily)
VIESIIEPRAASLPGEMKVKRVLPMRGGKMVGPFAFLDHMLPFEFSTGSGGDVAPHPHIGLSTVTFLLSGEIEHRDSIGTIQRITPGDLNWMTAGKGIVHSERIPPELRTRGGVLHGVQAWVALPREFEECEPSFQHFPAKALPDFEVEGTRVRLIAGSAFGRQSPAKTVSKLFYFESEIPAGRELAFDPEGQEAAFYLMSGKVSIVEQTIEGPALVLFKKDVSLKVRAISAAHGFFMGGDPFEEKRSIWWNFVSSSKDRIEEAKRLWSEQRFARVPGETEFIPLP